MGNSNMPFRFLCLAAVIAFVAASPRVTLEGDITAPSSWSLEGPAAAEMETSVYFFLKHPAGAEEKLEETLLAVSDPKSPSYGQHLSHDELRAMMFDPKASATLSSWLESHNVTEVAPTIVGDMVKV